MATYAPGVRVAFGDLDLSDPTNAFAYGLALGMAIEREAADPANDASHRAALAAAMRDVAQAEARAEADGRLPLDPAGYACPSCTRRWPWPAQAEDCCNVRPIDPRPGDPRRERGPLRTFGARERSRG